VALLSGSAGADVAAAFPEPEELAKIELAARRKYNGTVRERELGPEGVPWQKGQSVPPSLRTYTLGHASIETTEGLFGDAAGPHRCTL